jgi:glutamate N-acetyltransferase/amino-acid N-acetyltransferase
VTTDPPAGFSVCTVSAGLADDGRDDLTVIFSEVPATSAAMFTKSRFAGPSISLSREAARTRRVRGVIVIARNANVATGEKGAQHAEEVRRRIAAKTGVAEEELIIASTGVIGVNYPMASVRAALDRLPYPFPPAGPAGFDAAARAIMTTDTRPKIIRARSGAATLVGVAKGVGMIEPDMATMLTFFFTDAAIGAAHLDRVFRSVVERTFNALSIDTDTSTSDTAAIIANGLAGPVDVRRFEEDLREAALYLTREIARDGEGASKLIEVRVTGARDDAQAKRVGKSVVNSPLVKTAVHGGDPNWGRVAMAIGKCSEDLDIHQDRVRIGFGEQQVYPGSVDEAGLRRLAGYLAGPTVVIAVDLGIADGEFTVYGCDLTEGYVHLNSSYTT